MAQVSKHGLEPNTTARKVGSITNGVPRDYSKEESQTKGMTDHNGVNPTLKASETAQLSNSLKPQTEYNEILKPITPTRPIGIARNLFTGKYLLPSVTKDDILNARMFLKYYGRRKFLDTYLPDELNSLYLYFLIKLLGFEIKDQRLIQSIQSSLQDEAGVEDETALSFNDIGDPLSKRQIVRLIKDLQKAMNNILYTRIRLLNFSTIDDFVSRLHTAKNIIVLTGAGVSTSLGIPDFRSSEGFYSKVKYLGLSDPQDVFNFELFKKDPTIFYSIAYMILPPENIYSPLHSFIKMLHDKGKLLRNYTQNIDNLESYAGIPAEKLVQCHGSLATATCVTCHWKLSGEKIFGNIRRVELPLCPHCYKKRKELLSKSLTDPAAKTNGSDRDSMTQRSYGVLKPDITFFGEPLPTRFHTLLREDIPKCDLLICIGTSLKVAPVSEIINMVSAQVPQVLINWEPVSHASFDLSLLGYCDDIATLVARRCGWSIPHPKWKDLKDKKFDVTRQERGVYSISANSSSATSPPPVSVPSSTK